MNFDVKFIEDRFLKQGKSEILNNNQTYLLKKKELNEIKVKLSEFDIARINKNIIVDNENIQNLKNEKNKIIQIIKLENNRKSTIKNHSKNALPQKNVALKNRTYTFFPDWKNIHFDNGFYLIKKYSGYLKRYNNKSKKYLNEIKSYYSYKNIPKLEVYASGNEVIEIKNEYILYFHIDYFTASGHLFDFEMNNRNSIEKWKHYNKKHYKKNLNFLFTSNYLKKLCDICADDYPIIPVAEIIIGSNQSIQFHNSFLMPIKSKTNFFYIWESILENKATYIFEINKFDINKIQIIYDYINGKTKNKRDSLIKSDDLKKKIYYYFRETHSDNLKWHTFIDGLMYL